MPLNDFRTRQMLFGAVPPRVKQQPGMEIMGPNRPPIIQQQPTQDPALTGLYDNPSPALDAYRQHMMAMPQRDQYKPGIMGRITAGLTGAAEGLSHGAGAGMAASKKIMDDPYNTALEDYSNKGSVLGKMADIEGAETGRKMSYIKAFKDDNRADALANNTIRKTTSEIETAKQLTPAQVAHLGAQTASLGVTYQHNSADGHLYQIKPDGTQMDMGAYALTPQQKSTLDVKEFGQKEGIKLGNDKTMEGVKLENSKNFFNATQPIKDTSAKNVHEANRKVDAANPIPSNAVDFTAPSQYSIAQTSAVRDVVMANPGYAKFASADPTSAIKADKHGYEDYVKLVTNAKDKIIKGGNKRPLVTMPNQSPLDAPNSTPGPKVGDPVDYKGKKVKITAIHSDGTFDFEDIP